MRPIRYSLILASLLGLLVASAACQLQRCSEGAACSISKVSGPSAIPTPSPAATAAPSPTVTPSPAAESCRIDWMTLRPTDGLTLAKDERAKVSLTPYQQITNADGTVAQREVSEACNLPRTSSIVWTSSSAAVVVQGGGFEPFVQRVGVGVASITATLEGKVSNAVTVR